MKDTKTIVSINIEYSRWNKFYFTNNKNIKYMIIKYSMYIECKLIINKH